MCEYIPRNINMGEDTNELKVSSNRMIILAQFGLLQRAAFSGDNMVANLSIDIIITINEDQILPRYRI